jgi:hypothetical protein
MSPRPLQLTKLLGTIVDMISTRVTNLGKDQGLPGAKALVVEERPVCEIWGQATPNHFRCRRSRNDPWRYADSTIAVGRT